MGDDVYHHPFFCALIKNITGLMTAVCKSNSCLKAIKNKAHRLILFDSIHQLK